jgi:4-diphosphocytidyl-2-C-methyl-D-erythritol kinase
MTQRYFAPAKVNLSLRVGPALASGLHPLDSIVAFTSRIGDWLEISADPTLSLSINGPFASGLSNGEENLILRAARILADRLGHDVSARIMLTKNLPIASGIGGGSGDGAAALIGLSDLWQSGLSRSQLCELGAQLGADVPACIMGHPLHMTGTGETTTPIPTLPKLGIVLVNPLVACPTGPVYRHFDALGQALEQRPLNVNHIERISCCSSLDFERNFDPKGSKRALGLTRAHLPNVTTTDQLLDYLNDTPNDLEPAARQLVPEITAVLAAIASSKNVRLARMSGSGATCFGLFDTYAQARAGALEIKNKLAISPIWVEADEINTA